MTEAVPKTCTATLLSDTFVIKRLSGAKRAIGADRSGFDRVTIFQLYHAGDDAGVREIHLGDFTMSVGEEARRVPKLQALNAKKIARTLSRRDAQATDFLEWGIVGPSNI